MSSGFIAASSAAICLRTLPWLWAGTGSFDPLPVAAIF